MPKRLFPLHVIEARCKAKTVLEEIRLGVKIYGPFTDDVVAVCEGFIEMYDNGVKIAKEYEERKLQAPKPSSFCAVCGVELGLDPEKINSHTHTAKEIENFLAGVDLAGVASMEDAKIQEP